MFKPEGGFDMDRSSQQPEIKRNPDSDLNAEIQEVPNTHQDTDHGFDNVIERNIIVDEDGNLVPINKDSIPGDKLH